METDTMIMPKVHHGKNIKRFRDILGVNQDDLAVKLNLTQQAISRLEQKEAIDEETLTTVADALKIPIEAIKNMTDEGAINIIANTFNSYDTSVGNQSNHHCAFNPIEKIVELYERMLELEREKNK